MPQFRKVAILISSTTYLILNAPSSLSEQADSRLEEVYVTGGSQGVKELSGAATLIDEETISKFEITDLNTLLTQVPGVYIRQEDGYGLRPNINLRGTSSDRSSKLTIMEDSILIGPAPYSAPAAYYIPNIARMEALEVIKGPGTVAYGPHSVGGAINFVTRAIPTERGGELNLLVGEDGYRKANIHYGDSTENIGYWIDALHYGADGFKDLDSGGDTGFTRNDLNAKFQWKFNRQTLTAKIGYADEDADETYLGLTDADFEENPNRRYIASQLDRFVSEHNQVHISHNIEWTEKLKLTTTAYRNEFDRSWNKFDGVLRDGIVVSGSAILTLPGFYAQEYGLLTGQLDSSDDNGLLIDVTDNDRSFLSTGLQSKLNWSIEGERFSHDIDLGIRLHRDEVTRNHSQRGYLVQSSELIFDGDLSRPDKANNNGETNALALYAIDTVSIGKLKVNAGLRYESIELSFEERALDSEISLEESYSFLSPGLGAYYAITDTLGVLAGVNKGFSPNAASASSSETVPEESINYEAGMRYDDGNARFEAIGFFSDYENLIGRCRASDTCAGEEFNGGAVEVYGLELNASNNIHITDDWFIPLQLIYTYTESEFLTSFESSFVQWGNIEAGYELPYLPQQQASLHFGLEKNQWGIDFSMNYVGKMREIAGDDAIESAGFTEELSTINMALYANINEALTIKLLVDNIADEQEIVSRRPFGARPNQPRTSKLSVLYKF